jgi:hypothetical protein
MQSPFGRPLFDRLGLNPAAQPQVQQANTMQDYFANQNRVISGLASQRPQVTTQLTPNQLNEQIAQRTAQTSLDAESTRLAPAQSTRLAPMQPDQSIEAQIAAANKIAATPMPNYLIPQRPLRDPSPRPEGFVPQMQIPSRALPLPQGFDPNVNQLSIGDFDGRFAQAAANVQPINQGSPSPGIGLGGISGIAFPTLASSNTNTFTGGLFGGNNPMNNNPMNGGGMNSNQPLSQQIPQVVQQAVTPLLQNTATQLNQGIGSMVNQSLVGGGGQTGVGGGGQTGFGGMQLPSNMSNFLLGNGSGGFNPFR